MCSCEDVKRFMTYGGFKIRLRISGAGSVVKALRYWSEWADTDPVLTSQSIEITQKGE